MILDDRLLLWKLRRGDADAVRRVYDRHKHDMLGLAIALAGDRAAGEDIVHDVFLAFVRLCPTLRLQTSLRSYLLTAVANRVRNLGRTDSSRLPSPEWLASGAPDAARPDQVATAAEQATLVEQAMRQLPYEQRETIVLHLQTSMTFREIANSQNVSINTVLSRYRYGLQKLRSLLDGKVTP